MPVLTNNIKATVTDAKGKPVPVFKVFLVSPANGPYELGEGKEGIFTRSLGDSWAWVAGFQYSLIVEAPGHPPQISEPLIGSAHLKEACVILGKRQTIQCTVLSPDGSPAAGAFLYLPSGRCSFNPDGKLKSGGYLFTTDANGKLHFASSDLGELRLMHRDGALTTTWQELLQSKEVRLQATEEKVFGN